MCKNCQYMVHVSWGQASADNFTCLSICLHREGYNRQGLHKDGYDRSGFDRYGFDKTGHNKDGYDR
jgi:hypothetical protein